MGDRPPAEGEPRAQKRKGGEHEDEDKQQKGEKITNLEGDFEDVASEMFLKALDYTAKAKRGEPVPEHVLNTIKEVETLLPYFRTLTTNPEAIKELAFHVLQDILVSGSLYEYTRGRVSIALKPTQHWTTPLVAKAIRGTFPNADKEFKSFGEMREWALSQVPAGMPKTNKPLPPVPKQAAPAAPPKSPLVSEAAREGRLHPLDYDHIIANVPEAFDQIGINIRAGGPKLSLAQWEAAVNKKLVEGKPPAHYVEGGVQDSDTSTSSAAEKKQQKKQEMFRQYSEKASNGNLDRRQYSVIAQYYPGWYQLIGKNISNGGPRMTMSQLRVLQAEAGKAGISLTIDASTVEPESSASAKTTTAQPAAPPKKTNKPMPMDTGAAQPAAPRAAKKPAASTLRPKKTNKPLPGEERVHKPLFRGSNYNLWNAHHPRFFYQSQHPGVVDAGQGYTEDPVNISAARATSTYPTFR